MELWKDIPGFAYYQASNEGRVRRKAGTPRCPQPRILKPKIRKEKPGVLPYREVNLSHDGKKSSQTLHKLVALAFHGPRPSPDHEVGHRDSNVANNREDNLRWVTVEGNKADYRSAGKTWRDSSQRERDEAGRFV